MISNVIDSCSGSRGSKGAYTEERIADSQTEQESGSHASYSMYAAASLDAPMADQTAATSTPPVEGMLNPFISPAEGLASTQPQPEGTLTPSSSPAEGLVSAFPSSQALPEQFVLPNAQLTSTTQVGASTTQKGAETLNPLLSTESHLRQTSELAITPAVQQMAPFSALDGRVTSPHTTVQLSALQTQANKLSEAVISLSQTQASAASATELQGLKSQFLPQFSANLSAGKSANLNLPLALAESHLADTNETSAQMVASTHRATAAVSQWGPVPVSSSAPLAHQAQEMISPLREQIRFQIDQQIKHAELRLDPPELGKVELNIRLDGDRLHIHMHAANASVRDSLLIGLERLRTELAMDHGGQIDVDINQGKQDHRENPPEATTISLASVEELDTNSSKLDSQQSNQIDLLA